MNITKKAWEIFEESINLSRLGVMELDNNNNNKNSEFNILRIGRFELPLLVNKRTSHLILFFYKFVFIKFYPK